MTLGEYDIAIASRTCSCIRADVGFFESSGRGRKARDFLAVGASSVVSTTVYIYGKLESHFSLHPHHFRHLIMASQSEQKVAEIVVESIYNAGVKVVFGIPGAKVDAIFDTLSGMVAQTLQRRRLNADLM